LLHSILVAALLTVKLKREWRRFAPPFPIEFELLADNSRVIVLKAKRSSQIFKISTQILS
ncbi:MAG: hypothetical protein ACK400_06630, partial [Pseudanabaena sp.]